MLRIKEIAKQKGLSMEDIAERLGINRVSLSRNINGNPTIETLNKIADVLGVNIRELFAHEDNGNEVSGFVKINGTIHEVKSFGDLEQLIESSKE